MNKSIIVPLFLSSLCVGFVAVKVRSAAQSAKPVQTKTLASSLQPLKTTYSVVDAANAFLATLSKAQQGQAQIGLTSQLAAKWSNFPAGFVPRNGVYFRDMNSAQTAAALKIAKLALSKDGFARFQEVRATDDAFAKLDEGPGGPGRGGQPGRGGDFGGPLGGGFGGPEDAGPDDGGPGGGPGGFDGPGGGNLFGDGNYIIAFLGTPSKTSPWLLQIGGHHLAFNIYYKGTTGSSTPYFVGAQPNVWKDAQGKTHAPLAPMRDAVYGLVNSLSPQQSKLAKLATNFDDVYVGPNRDGQFPKTSEGIAVSQLSEASKNFVKQAIAAWTGDSAQAASYRKLYDAELERTKIAYSGTKAVADTGDYVRIDGPHVWIEFACQGSDHYHTIWRDRATDYGAEFTFESVSTTRRGGPGNGGPGFGGPLNGVGF